MKDGEKVVKPVEMMQSRTKGSKPLVQMLWFERAEKILKQVEHTFSVMEFLEYVTLIANRFY